MDEDLLSWLQLSRSENVGPLTFYRLLKRYKTPREALKALPELAAQGGLKRPLKIASLDDVKKELDATLACGATLLTSENPLYPPLLRHIDSAPPVLTVKGRIELLQMPLLAIVGARNASAMGKKMAHQFADGLGKQGWIISSGLARGIDAAAHRASLTHGTIAVLAGGLDQIYPPENEALYNQIGEEGVLLAESPFGTQPQATLFPRRNRIISGLSRCILVVEAALKSGFLITARCALDQGREVFAIPGHPLDPRARGCNNLIKNGAVLVETLEDIQQEISPSTPLRLEESSSFFEETLPSSSLDNVRHILNENLSTVPISIDELIRECQLSASDVWIVLLEMEMAGRLERLPGGKVSLKEEWISI
ncbi:MAG: DNA protecting protein DprA [Alphaproteobacteria bacterium 41-28]|nr:MAG: DNA protecting protein DprA [Alphaproteobacteria bacterium 41-28]